MARLEPISYVLNEPIWRSDIIPPVRNDTYDPLTGLSFNNSVFRNVNPAVLEPSFDISTLNPNQLPSFIPNSVATPNNVIMSVAISEAGVQLDFATGFLFGLWQQAIDEATSAVSLNEIMTLTSGPTEASLRTSLGDSNGKLRKTARMSELYDAVLPGQVSLKQLYALVGERGVELRDNNRKLIDGVQERLPDAQVSASNLAKRLTASSTLNQPVNVIDTLQRFGLGNFTNVPSVKPSPFQTSADRVLRTLNSESGFNFNSDLRRLVNQSDYLKLRNVNIKNFVRLSNGANTNNLISRLAAKNGRVPEQTQYSRLIEGLAPGNVSLKRLIDTMPVRRNIDRQKILDGLSKPNRQIKLSKFIQSLIPNPNQKVNVKQTARSFGINLPNSAFDDPVLRQKQSVNIRHYRK